ncbi:MAG: NYN domain, limkain-b1-type [Magnetococcales bacterium]|nr:NYN domain, limkain-b1-type [Magnetococcales bacterium]
MPYFDASCIIFVDYDNLLPQQKTKGLLDIITQALVQMPFWVNVTRAKCDVRVYGGWYEGETLTQLAQNVTVELQRDFPAIIRLPMRNEMQVALSVYAELAVALIQEPDHFMFNTYRRKGKPANIRIEKPEDVGCNDEECLLPLMKKMLKKGRCPKTGCTVGQVNLIYRHEQKIVDTMLACDMIYAANKMGVIALVSSDDDFLPPLRTITLQGIKVVRFHTQPNSQRASCSIKGAELLEMDL